MDDGVDPGDDALRGDLRRRLGLAGCRLSQIDEIARPFLRFATSCQGLWTRRMDLDDHPAAEIRLGIEAVEQAAEAGPYTAAPALLARRRPLHPRFEPGDPHLERRQVTGVLVGKVVVEGLPVEAGSVED